MRLLSICIALFLSVLHAAAGPVSLDAARRKAQLFLGENGASVSLTDVSDAKARSSVRRAPGSSVPEYYVFNKGTRDGFVIVSGDDRTEPILGYSDSGTFDYATLPPAMQQLLENYATQIAALRPGDLPAGAAAVVPTHPKVAQLMTCTWSQSYPYNLSCPLDNDGNRSVTGCVATAMAQIMYYNREKMVTETQATIPAFESWSHKLRVAAVPEGAPIDWDNMRDNGGSSELQRKAVADLMFYCGASVKMDYTSSSSGAQVWDAYLAFVNYFGFGSSVTYHSGDKTDQEWDQIVYSDIAAGRAVYVSGYNESGGHAFVADGYDGNRRYHINWGWGGMSDGYYLLTNLTPGQQGTGGTDKGYSNGFQIITGLEPVNYATRPMSFSDGVVKRLCLSAFDSDGDGRLTYGEAATVTSLGDVFKGQRIQTFDELRYFTALTALDDDAFNGCQQLTSLRLPKTLKQLGRRAFAGCRRLTSLELPTGLTAIGEETFSGCEALTALTLPLGLRTLEARALSGCKKLSEMTLPVTLQTVADGVFTGCTALSSVAVKTFSPATLSVGAGVFDGCDLPSATLTVMQGTAGWYRDAAEWQSFGTITEERELSEGRFAALEPGKKYYFYHVGTGQYLTMGEAWGTQAVVGRSPMRFDVRHTAAMPDGVYYLTSEDTGRSGNYLFRTSDDGNVGKGVHAVFVDGSITTNGRDGHWLIEKVDDALFGNNTYRMQVPQGYTGYVAGQYWGIQTDHRSDAASPTYGVYSDVSYTENPQNCLWRLVEYDAAATDKFQAVNTLANLLALAKSRGMKTVVETAVYNDIASDTRQILTAQSSLRRRIGFVDFKDNAARSAFVDLGDINSDSELSKSEAAVISDLNVSLRNNTELTSLDELQYFTSVTTLGVSLFSGCRNLTTVTLPENIRRISSLTFQNCKALQTVTLFNATPSDITVPANAFTGVTLADCTLRVPMGSGQLYASAPVWKDFGSIQEVRLDERGAVLGSLLAVAGASGVDTAAEQAVYTSSASSASDVEEAIASLRSKLHYIDFADDRARSLCLENWDTDMDGELTREEAAAVTSLGSTFQGVSGLKRLSELRYFTSLREIPSSAFKGDAALETVFLPEGVTTAGEYAFSGCPALRYLVVLNASTLVPQKFLGLPTGVTLFVPATMTAAYAADSAWTSKCTVVEYTGHPVVTAEAERYYGASTATPVVRVSGAPVSGEPSLDCPTIADASAPVGRYTIAVGRGTIADDDVTLHDGVLTVNPWTLTVTPKDYVRNVGEPNPDFEYTCRRFRNGEDISVLLELPTLSCEATADSPAGLYPIVATGARAVNYDFKYVEGTLRVVDPTAVRTVRADGSSARPVYYDLQGRPVTTLRRGVYISDGRKVVVP